MSNTLQILPAVRKLLDRGVLLPCPYSVEVDASVNPERIAPGVIIHTGCRIAGSKTSIGPGSELGRESPVVIEDCQLGHNVQLKGGYFAGATFLNGASMGSAAHVRPGTLLEEEAGGAHAVGLKQTIFLSFVTAGSLINFCDALVAGGTSKKNHSEIGSSYVHFNFTPYRDKATPSLLGDVPRGVFLDQPPIFLGGQGGLVGPARIAYGTVIAAGTVCRRDILEEGTLFSSVVLPNKSSNFRTKLYRNIDRIVRNNLIFIGNLWALKSWYQLVRIRTMTTDIFTQACHAGALARIDEGLRERIKRLKELVDQMADWLKHAGADRTGERQLQVRAQQVLAQRWPDIEARLSEGPPAETGIRNRDHFLREWEQIDVASGHCKAVSLISPQARKAGVAWLQEIVNSVEALWPKV